MFVFTARRPCSDCGSEVIVSAEQQVTEDEKLFWLLKYTCHTCKTITQASLIGDLDRYRNYEMHMNGEWALKLNTLGQEPRHALKAIKDVLNLSYGEVAEIRRNMPTIALSGTKFEMEFYSDQMLKRYNGLDLHISLKDKA